MSIYECMQVAVSDIIHRSQHVMQSHQALGLYNVWGIFKRKLNSLQITRHCCTQKVVHLRIKLEFNKKQTDRGGIWRHTWNQYAGSFQSKPRKSLLSPVHLELCITHYMSERTYPVMHVMNVSDAQIRRGNNSVWTALESDRKCIVARLHEAHDNFITYQK